MKRHKITIIVFDISFTGGLSSVVRYLSDVIISSNIYDLKIISLASSSKDPLSRRIFKPSTWFGFPKSSKIHFLNYECFHVGADFSELEFQRYKSRQVLRDLLVDTDLIQVVAGSPAISLSVLGLGIPVFLQVATRSIVERKSLLNKDFSLLSIYRRLINILVDQIDNYCIKNVDSIFVENNWMFNYCSKMQLDGAPQIHLAYPGINTYKFKPLENRMLFIDKDFYILSVGRFSDPRKNIIFLLECYIKIFNKFSTPPKLVLAGASSPDSKFWDLVLENNLQEFVEFRSNPSEEELIAIYQGACCFALTSNEEGFGMVLIEAMSCGIPVVSTKCGGPDSIISDSSDGFLVDIGDHEKFSESLFHLCIHKGANLNMGHIARSNALRRYSHDSTKELFLNEYKKFLST